MKRNEDRAQIAITTALERARKAEAERDAVAAQLVAQRPLVDAVLALWSEMPAEQVRVLREDALELVHFCQHLHHSIEHEQAMMRVNVWARPDPR